MKRVLLALSFAAAAAAPALGWGTDGHRLATGWAIEATPAGAWRDFLAEHRRFLVTNCVTPDMRRANERADSLPERESPRHYIDLEHFRERGIDPSLRSAPPADADASWGLVPWAIQEEVEAASAAMRAGDWTEALRRLADLAHYAEDACVPLHTTANYDGQLSGQHGVHSRWESDLVERRFARLWAEGGPPPVEEPPPAAEPIALAWTEIRRAHALVPAVLEADSLATSADTRRSEIYEHLFEEAQAADVRERLRASATHVARLWHLAWARAGGPEPPRGLKVFDRAVLGGQLEVDDRTGRVLWAFETDDAGSSRAAEVGHHLVVRADGDAVWTSTGGDPGPRISGSWLADPERLPDRIEVDLRLDASPDAVPENGRMRLTWRKRRR